MLVLSLDRWKSLSESISDRPLTSIAIHCVRQLTQGNNGWLAEEYATVMSRLAFAFNVCFRFLHFLRTPELSHPWSTGSNPQLDNREDECQFQIMLILYDNYVQD